MSAFSLHSPLRAAVFAAILFSLPLSPARAAEIIVFDGVTPGLLGTGPIWGVLNSLFPTLSPMGNTVTVAGGAIPGDVYGGITASAADAAANNNVTVISGQVDGDVLGGASDSGNAFGNSVGATGGSVGGSFFGGYSKDSGNGNASGNSVNMGGVSFVTVNVYGGYSANGDAYDNSVILGGDASVAGYAYGGFSTNSNAYNNSLSIIGNASVIRDVFGGVSYVSGEAYSNSVSISGGSVSGIVAGGFSISGNAYGNGVTIGDGLVAGAVYGGASNGGGYVSNNSVTINGGSLGNGIYGGFNLNGNAFGNSVNLGGSASVNLDAYGGYSENGNAYNNSLSISGNASLSRHVYGGLSYVSGEAYGNRVSISGGSVADTVAGGFSRIGNAYSNSVTISGGSVTGTVYGGASDGSGNAYSNSVTITGGSLGNGIFGGASGGGNASGNSVTITGGSVAGTVYGGLSPSGDATYNTVTIGRGAVFTPTSVFFGGDTSTGADAFTGNTLNVKTSGLTVQGLYNFQNLNFYLPPTLAAGGTVLSVTGEARLSENADGSGRQATVNVGIEGGSAPLKAGDRIVLINAGTLTGTPANSSATGQGMQGVTLLYSFDLQTLNNQLFATVASTPPTDPAGPTDPAPPTDPVGPMVNPQTKALSEGRISGLAFVNQGADLAAGQGMASMLAATGGVGPGARGPNGVVGFGTMSGGTSRYNSGSHTDVDGFSLITGLGWRAPMAQDSLLFGAFFEAGWGNYNSRNSFNNAASIKGSGDTEYYGGGILARYDLAGGFLSGLYTEASLRAGHVSTDFSSNDLRDFSGRRASYDSGSAYYGAHAGLGYIWQLNEKATLDFSTKYLWTRQDSDSVAVVGDPVRFKAANSQRWRNGARFSYAVDTESGTRFTPYIGAAYDHEFDGKAKASTNGYAIDAPDLKGGTGVGELGLIFKPAAGSAFSMDLSMQGYTGVREGVGGSFQLKYEF